MIEKIIEEILNSKKYNCISIDTIKRICKEESLKFKKEKDVLKSVKTKLHIITDSYFSAEEIKTAYKILNEDCEIKERCQKLLECHTSSKERLGHITQLYEDIFCAINEKVEKVCDIACGLNPLFFLTCDDYNFKIEASDIHDFCIDIIKTCYQQANKNIVANCKDILCEVPNGEYDLTIMFKLVPLLEQQKKGKFAEIIEKINSKYFVVSFPTKTLTGKNVGMVNYYKDFFNDYIEKSQNQLLFFKEYSNEIVFLFKKERV